MSAPYDIAIRGGTLIDGTGAAGRPGDLAIQDGRIAALGDVPGEAARTFDASGCAVSPGFVDIHTHYDAQVLWDRMLSISPWHGVTTVVMGNCGFGIAPTRPEHRSLILRTLESVEGMSLDALRAGVGDDWPFETFPEYLDAIAAGGTAINVAALVGHTPIRLYVMGEEATEREATTEEVAEMARLVTEALAAGALGFATSKAPTHVGYAGKPVPSRAASFEEIRSLADCLGEAGRGLMQATVGRGLFINELSEIQQRIGRTVSWTALLAGLFGPDGHGRVLETTAKLQSEGIDVVPQVSCRPLVVEFQFKAPFPFESLSIFEPVSAADFEGKKRLYADPEWRATFRERSNKGVLTGDWQDMLISESPSEPALADRPIAEVAAERGVHPADLALDLALASDLEARFRMPVANTDEVAVAELLTHPGTMLGLSDAGAHASQLCDACAPTHLLSHWVREKGVLTLEEGVRQLTSDTADRFGIGGRGRLAEGAAADVTVFDPRTVGCTPLRRVWDFPAGADRLVSDATGIRGVFVNGVLLREDGVDVIDPDGPLPGRVLPGRSRMSRPVISADSHITEPANTYVDYIDPRYRDVAPKLVRTEKAGDVFVIDGMAKPVPMGLVAAAGKPVEEIRVKGVLFDEMHRGGWDPEARLADQERDGVAAEIIYPTVGMVLCNHSDPDYKQACFEAYNRWITSFCDPHPERLLGVGQTAMRTPDDGIRDLREIQKLGLRGVMMPGHPATEDYDSPIYDDFWYAAIDLGLPLSFHILTTRAELARGPRMNNFLTIMRGCQDIVGTLILGGVFERHPTLKVVCAEADAGWVPHYMYRMDHAYKRHRNWLPPGQELSKLPSEYFRENIYTTFQDDWVAFKTVNLTNWRHLMWANDFPHSDSTWPWSQQMLAEHVDDLTTEQADAILGENAAALYGIDLSALG